MKLNQRLVLFLTLFTLSLNSCAIKGAPFVNGMTATPEKVEEVKEVQRAKEKEKPELCFVCLDKEKVEEVKEVQRAKEKEKPELCFVCLDNKKDYTTCAGCKKSFHTKCIVSWFKTNRRRPCPNCRKENSIAVPEKSLPSYQPGFSSFSSTSSSLTNLTNPSPSSSLNGFESYKPVKLESYKII